MTSDGAEPPAYVTCILSWPSTGSPPHAQGRLGLVSALAETLACKAGVGRDAILDYPEGPRTLCPDLVAVTFRISALNSRKASGQMTASPAQIASKMCMAFAGGGIGGRGGGGGGVEEEEEEELVSFETDDANQAEASRRHLFGGMIVSVSYTVGRPACGVPGRSVRMRACVLSSDEEFACERSHISKKVVPLLRHQITALGGHFSWLEITWSAADSDRSSSLERMKVIKNQTSPTSCPKP